MTASLHLVDATVYIDAEGVGIEQGNPGGTPRSAKLAKGYARLKFTPSKPGKIRLCAVLETGDDQVLTGALEIRVVPVKLGEVWETVYARRIKKVEGGWKDVSDDPVARAAGLNEIWDWVLNLFGRSSRTVNQVRQRVHRATGQGAQGVRHLRRRPSHARRLPRQQPGRPGPQARGLRGARRGCSRSPRARC